VDEFCLLPPKGPFVFLAPDSWLEVEMPMKTFECNEAGCM
jgi:hypothetical protein